MPGPAESWSRKVTYVFAVQRRTARGTGLPAASRISIDRIDRRPEPARRGPRRRAARPSSRRTGRACASPGFVQDAVGRAGHGGQFAPDRGSTATDGELADDDLGLAERRRRRRAGAAPARFDPTAASAGTVTVTVSACGSPRLTPSTWTSASRPRWTPEREDAGDDRHGADVQAVRRSPAPPRYSRSRTPTAYVPAFGAGEPEQPVGPLGQHLPGRVGQHQRPGRASSRCPPRS